MIPDDDPPHGSLDIHWHPAHTPEYLTAAIARVRARLGLTETTAVTVQTTQTTGETTMTADTFATPSATQPLTDGLTTTLDELGVPASFLCPSIRRCVDADHDRAGLLARLWRVTPVAVAMETATCPECGATFERRAHQDYPRRYCTGRCYQRMYNRASKVLRDRARKGWAA